MIVGQTKDYNIVITEIGGTVGDIESQPYLEAMRQLRWKLGPTNCITIHLTLIPYLTAAGELKTKPTQHSVKELLENGIQPDILVCRTEHALTKDIRRKIALFCNVNINAVIEAIDVPSIYEVPLAMHKERLDRTVLGKLKLSTKHVPDLDRWKSFIERLRHPEDELDVGLIGK
jgi:CTP synthase